MIINLTTDEATLLERMLWEWVLLQPKKNDIPITIELMLRSIDAKLKEGKNAS